MIRGIGSSREPGSGLFNVRLEPPPPGGRVTAQDKPAAAAESMLRQEELPGNSPNLGKPQTSKIN